MRHVLLLLLICLPAWAQYEDRWEKVYSLEEAGKIKSADTEVNDILSRAVKEKREPEILRCFFYHNRFLHSLSDHAVQTILEEAAKPPVGLSAPSEALMLFIQAQILQQYYVNHYWEIDRRTANHTDPGKPLTWSRQDFSDGISVRLKNSLRNRGQLQHIKAYVYRQLFDFRYDDDPKNLSLLECLLREHAGLRVGLTEAGKRTRAVPNALFADATLFTADTLRIGNAETDRVIARLQEIERLSPSDRNRFERLTRIENLIGDDLRLESAFDNFQTPDLAVRQEIFFRRYRKVISGKAPDRNIEGLRLLDSILSIPEKSNVYWKSVMEQKTMQNRELEVRTPSVVTAGRQSRIHLAYRNLTGVDVVVFRLNRKQTALWREFPQKHDSLGQVFSNIRVTAFRVDFVKERPDYLPHTTEVLLPSMEPGQYLVAFTPIDPSGTTNERHYSAVTASNLMPLARELNERHYVQIVHRETGKSMSGVQISNITGTSTTDRDGEAVLPYSRENKVRIAQPGDTLDVDFRYSPRFYNFSPSDTSFETGARIYFDRAIYRPGQRVWYKVIVVKETLVGQEAAPQLHVLLTFENDDDTIVTKLVLTNDFGSASGYFDLPKAAPTGRYSLTVGKPTDEKDQFLPDVPEPERSFWHRAAWDDENATFEVEEYKRPRFEVAMEPFEEALRLGDSVRLSGRLQAFDGSSLAKAEIRFVVHRTEGDETHDPKDDEPALVSGNVKSDAEGKFRFVFAAVPHPEDGPETVYTYHVRVEATDTSGETHEVSTSVTAGNRKRIIRISAPWRCDTFRKNTFTVSATNLNGGQVPTKGTVRLFRRRLVREAYMPRPWAKPDRPVIDSLTYDQLFPFEKTEEENQQLFGVDRETQDENGELMATIPVDTALKKEWPLDFIDLYPSGDYRLVFTSEEGGKEEKSSYDFRIQQHRDPFDRSKLVTLTAKDVLVGAKNVVVQVASPVPDLTIRIAAFYDGQQFFQQDLVLEAGQGKVRIPLLPQFQDGIMISAETVYKGCFFVESHAVTIPREEQRIAFGTQTFRNRIAPGQREEWLFDLNEPETEVLASMYDRSLDLFTHESWKWPTMRHYFIRSFAQRLAYTGQTEHLRFKQLNEWSPQPVYRQEKPGLIWFGFSINNGWFDRNAYNTMLQRKSPAPANARRVRGVVTDETGAALSWASVSVRGSRRATLTNLDGSFEIEVAPEETLEFVSSGMLNTQTKARKSSIEVRMKALPGQLREVVVDSYEISRPKVKSNAAATTVSSVSFEYETSAGFFATLQSQVAGLNISTASGASGGSNAVILRGVGTIRNGSEPLYIIDGVPLSRNEFLALDPTSVSAVSTLKSASAIALYGNRASNGVIVVTTKKAVSELVSVTTRKNLSETAFFLPHLQTDKKGLLRVSFESPEALTEWNFRMLAHTKKMVSGLFLGVVRTQKDLMVAPNFPRFLRENDHITVKVRVSNLTATPKTGTIRLTLTDQETGLEQNQQTGIGDGIQSFTAPSMGTTTLSWALTVPEGLKGLRYKVVAKAGDFSDGEENLIPVLTDAMLVTESQPLWVREGSTQKITLPTLATPSNTQRPHLLTLEYTSNPAWSALQSLPYLMEFEHECSEQLFSRFYAQRLARRLLEANPKIAGVFTEWAKGDSTEVQNDDLRRLIAAETPWADDLKKESEKKKHLARLFDAARLESESSATLQKLSERQLSSGGFSWYGGEHQNAFITRHIIGGFGHLLRLGALDTLNVKVKDLLDEGIAYIDEDVLVHDAPVGKGRWRNRSAGLHYLYVRSFFLYKELPNVVAQQLPALLSDVRQHWQEYTLYEKGMAALASYRWGEKDLAKSILEQVKETAVSDTTDGIHWNANVGGWSWNQSPIETQSLLIEAFAEIGKDAKTVDGMKVWLLGQRSRSHWPTTKASADAIYALLMEGRDWLSVKENTTIVAGDQRLLEQKREESKEEAGTGYMKLQWKPSEISPALSQIEIRNDSKVPGYGGIFWQYFEKMEKVQTGTPTGLSVLKELFYKPLSGPTELLKNNEIRIGDRVLVRLTVTADHDFEFVHLKDVRASCLEPVDVLSAYEWMQGAGYYKTTRDAATHYFFERLPKGVYVLEYEAKVNNAGDFSAGIATIESMYAPAFSGRSSGGRIETKE